MVKALTKELERYYKELNSKETTYCYMCKSPQCYELSIQELDGKKFICKNYLQFLDGFLCSDCYEFYVNTGKWFTCIQTVTLRFLLLFRKKHAKT